MNKKNLDTHLIPIAGLKQKKQNFGIIADQRIEPQTVKLKVSAGQANYIRDLRLHESQDEIEKNEEYSIFKYFLRPTFDFMQEILWNGEDMEVLEPQSLRKEIAGIINRMNKKYKVCWILQQ